jgi:hypothetical protein
MIEALILKNGQPVAKVEIKNINVNEDGTADYQVRFGVERGSAVGLHRRLVFSFPRKRLNVLALLRLSLETLNEKELELERDFDPDEAEAPVSSDLARRLSGPLREIQAGFSRLHRH